MSASIRPPLRVPVLLSSALSSALAAALTTALCGCGGVGLFSVDPGTVPAGGVIDVTGAGFDDGLQLRLEGDGGTVSLGVVVDGSAAAQGTLPGSTPAGSWDVVAVTDAGEARLPGALTVVAGRLEAFFVDVGQGDATVLLFPDGQTLLIDGGPRDAEPAVRAVLDDLLTSRADGRVDAVAITHTDADHLGGIVGVLRGFDGRAGSDDDVVPPLRLIGHDDALCDSQLCEEFRAVRGVPFAVPDLGTVYEHGGATVTVVARDGDVDGAAALAGIDEENERSLAFLIEFGGRSLFIGGDLTGGGLGTADVEAAVAAVTGPVDVLHLNHHGSQTSSSQGFLDALQPRAVVLSVGTDNAFCHPEERVVERVTAAGVAVYATGSGVVDSVDRCDAATAWPPGSRHGLGTFSLVIDADGTLTMAGDTL